MGGHVFITHGDLTRLYCDAWLLPSDAGFNLTSGFSKRLPDEILEQISQVRQGMVQPPSGWASGQGLDRVMAFRTLGLTADRRIPQPYLVSVGAYLGIGTDWYLDGVRQFIEAATSAYRADPESSVSRRSKPLFALPLVGTGAGGASRIKGDITRELVEELHELADAHEVDIALVTRSARAFSAAQNARYRYLDHRRGDEPTPMWPGLPPALVDAAIELAGHAVSQRLVLFLGAGVSNGAGLPTWDALLDRLARDADMNEVERKALGTLHDLDRARIIESRLELNDISIGAAVAECLTSEHYALAHSLLAALPVDEIVTTNYDCLFEQASADADRAVAVLPYQPVTDRTRWLLKLHGTTDQSEDIVLTREDYLRYADRRAALSGIVQALLITRHMLFVGFSLTDDNFHRIVDDVRKAIRGTGKSPAPNAAFATALLLKDDALRRELWKEDVDFVPMTAADAEPGQAQAQADAAVLATDVRANAARDLEIFLDVLLAESTHGISPILDPSFEGVLTEEERELRDLLVEMEEKARSIPSLQASNTWRPVAEMLQRFGGNASS